MTRVAILPEPANGGTVRYRAIAGKCQSVGRTAGEALDALSAQLPADQIGTLVVVRSLEADQFFAKRQCARLEELMARWRAARDRGNELSSAEQAELESLVGQEVAAAGRRAAALSDELQR